MGAGLIAAGILALVAGLLWRQLEGDKRGAIDGTTLLALALPDVQGKDQPIGQ